jgi:hypothetical protein
MRQRKNDKKEKEKKERKIKQRTREINRERWCSNQQ